MLSKWKRVNVDDKGEDNTNTERQRKFKAASNYRPVACLPLVWKLSTDVTGKEVYEFLDTNLLLPQEQK